MKMHILARKYQAAAKDHYFNSLFVLYVKCKKINV